MHRGFLALLPLVCGFASASAFTFVQHKQPYSTLIHRASVLPHHRMATRIAAKKLINEPNRVVEEMVEGMLLTDSRIARLGSLNVILRSNVEQVKEQQVTLISGGGSGHEPAHAGFVADGMLTGAVLGSVFASPSVSSILATIRATCGPHGCLLIVKNYTGDRLNFGMALEQAAAEGYKCKMVIVEDDCALPRGKGITGGRGVAGTLFVHKVAGAAAAAGLDLDAVHTLAVKVANCTGTLGVALSVCVVPGTQPSNRLEGDKAEVGMGIHGEQGLGQETLQDHHGEVADFLTSQMVTAILGNGADKLPRISVAEGDNVAVMINNLGATPLMELLIVARKCMHLLVERGIKPKRFYIGPLMTALEMAGVSISFLKVDDEILEYLDAGTSSVHWPKAAVLPGTLEYRTIQTNANEQAHAASTATQGGLMFSPETEITVRRVMSSLCLALVDMEPLLTEWDSKVGDGDCGLTVKNGATYVLQNLSLRLQEAQGSVVSWLNLMADDISSSMGGTSGVLIELFLRAMARECRVDQSEGVWKRAFVKGVDAIKFYGGADRGFRTLLDAFIPAAEVFAAGGNIAEAATAAVQGAEETKTMKARAGRSNYLSDEAITGIPDPGAVATAKALEAAAAALSAVDV